MTAATARHWITGKIDLNVALSFVFGVTFVLVMLAFAVGYPNPTPFQVKVFVTVLALAAAGVGAVLPGYIDVGYKHWLRAGGAVALFAVVYLIQPVLEKNVISYQSPTEDPKPIALAFLVADDEGRILDAWRQLDPATRELSFTSVESMWEIYRSYRKPLGAVVSREMVGVSGAQSPPGAPVGLYRFLKYRTLYRNTSQCYLEMIALRATEDIRWRVSDYEIYPTPVPCESHSN
jgi:hypothetical protein